MAPWTVFNCAVCRMLKRRPMACLLRLPGDTPNAAQAIGGSLGIKPENIYGGMKPADKADVISQLKVLTAPHPRGVEPAVPWHRTRHLRSAHTILAYIQPCLRARGDFGVC